MSQTRSGFAATTDTALFRRVQGVLQTLMIERGGETEHGKWAMPGGHIDPEDTYDLGKAAARELLEETGVDAGQFPFPIILRYAGKRESDNKDWIGYTFWGAVGSHHDIMQLRAADDASDYRWVTYPELSTMIKAGQVAFDHGVVLDYLFDQVDGIL